MLLTHGCLADRADSGLDLFGLNILIDWYHVLNRGRQRDAIFPEAKDYETFLQTVSRVVERMKARARDKKLAGREGEKFGFADHQESRADLPPLYLTLGSKKQGENDKYINYFKQLTKIIFYEIIKF